MRRIIKKIIALSLTVICITNLILQVEAQSVQAENPMTAEEKIETIQNPIDTDEGKVVSSYLYFGSYPQSEVTGDALTSAIINADYDENGDAVVNGQKYRRVCEEDAYYTESDWIEYDDPNAVIYDYHFFDWSGENAGYHYFKYEPIKWQVYSVVSGKAILVSDAILDHRSYSEYSIQTKWDSTSIRFWLNGYDSELVSINYNKKNFWNTAFSDMEKEMVCNTDVMQSDVEFSEVATSDKVVLINENLVKQLSESECVKKLTEYAIAMGMPYGNNLWWVMDSYNQFLENDKWNCNYISHIGRTGVLNDDYYGQGCSETSFRAYAEENTIGVVPCITLDLNSTNLWMTEDEYLVYRETGVSVMGYEKGDIDTDGEITLEDAKIALRAALGIQLLSYKQKVLSDFDGSNTINLQDAKEILKVALGIGKMNMSTHLY